MLAKAIVDAVAAPHAHQIRQGDVAPPTAVLMNTMKVMSLTPTAMGRVCTTMSA